ncbi:MAG: hypothetical protein AAF634_11620 [Bacteroidota bacterium]
MIRGIQIILLLSVFCSFGQKTSAELIAIGQANYNNMRDDFWENCDYSTHLNSLKLYQTDNQVYSFVMHYGVTRNSQVIDDIITGYDDMISDAVPVYGGNEGYLGWPSINGPTNDKRALEGTPLHEFKMGGGMMAFLWLVRTDFDLWNTPAYQEKYNVYLAFMSTHVSGKWNQNQTQAQGFVIERENLHMASESNEVELRLHYLTQGANPQNLTNAQNFMFAGMPSKSDGNLRDNLDQGLAIPLPNNAWYETWPNSSPSIHDWNHAVHMAARLYMFWEMGFHLTEADMQRVAQTFESNLVGVNPITSNVNLDGTGGTRNAGTQVGFVMLSLFDTSLRNTLENNVNTISSGSNNFLLASILAYNRLILEQGRPNAPSHYRPADGEFDFGAGTTPPVDQPTLPFTIRQLKNFWFAFN